MRKRIEDLGRIAVMINNVLDLEVWDCYFGRRKDFIDHFRGLDEEKQDTLLHKLIYGLDELKDKLCEISSVAEGTDSLNEPPEL
jgi:hypothetical protein